jgi:LPS export ABC transporter protein LptC/lipopolysaccharide transport protein LptA
VARWHRLIRLALALFAVAFAIGVYYSIKPRVVRPPDKGAQRIDPTATFESTAGEVILFKGSKQDIRIQYQTRITYQSGRTIFNTAKISVMQRGGRDFVATSKEAEVADNQSKMDMRGDVVITASDGLVIKSNEATYTQNDETMRMPGQVTFARNRMKGTSNGATYDRNRDVLWLLDQAHITVAPDDKGQGSADVTSGGAGYARRDRYIRFERNVKMLRGTQVVEAPNAVAYLEEKEDKLKTLELRGGSRVLGVGSGANSLQAMTARDINLNYGPDGEKLQRAVLIGDAVVQMANAQGGPGQKLVGQTQDVELGADGNTLLGLQARERVQLDLPGDPNTPARQIRSAALDAGADAGQTAISRARFSDHVEFRETKAATPTAPAVERTVRAPMLDAKVQAGLSQIDEALFSGGVTIKDGTRDASGPTMAYNVAKGQFGFSGPVVAGRPLIHVSDERIIIDAQKIDWTVDGKNMVADGDVKSVLKAQKPAAAPGAPASTAGAVAGAAAAGKPAPVAQAPAPAAPGQGAAAAAAKPGAPAPAAAAAAAAAGGGDFKQPGILASDQPTNVTAKHLVYDSDTGHADYTGDSWLWQAETSIKGESITVDQKTGNLSASGTVRSTMRLENTEDKDKDPAKDKDKDAKGKAPAKDAKGKAGAAASDDPNAKKGTLTVATASELLYEDNLHRATYTTDAHVVGEQGDLKGDKVELYLDESGKGLQRLEAYTKVLFNTKTQEGYMRRGTSTRLTYFATDGRYVMAGAPAHVQQQLPQECRETTGQTLTFFKPADSVTVDGNAETRTQSKSSGTCPELTP